MKFELTCTYCGHVWNEDVYSEYSLNGKKCVKCQDKKIKVKNLTASKVNYYEGAPEFPVSDDDWNSAYMPKKERS